MRGNELKVEIVDNRTKDWGHIYIDHIDQTDIKPGVPVFRSYSRGFTIDHRYLVIPVKNGVKKCLLTVSIDGIPVRRYNTELAKDSDDVDWWAFFTLERYKGKPAVVSVDRATSEVFELVCQSDKVPGSDSWYTEALRPQFHFSQKVGWINDGNGMVYYDGEYHLFFQHNPVGWKWDNMTWGHAISKDLVHWQQQPNKLFPWTMAQKMCYSGGATVDKKNTAGFKTGKEDVIVAFLTDTGAGECIAYKRGGVGLFLWYGWIDRVDRLYCLYRSPCLRARSGYLGLYQ